MFTSVQSIITSKKKELWRARYKKIERQLVEPWPFACELVTFCITRSPSFLKRLPRASKIISHEACTAAAAASTTWIDFNHRSFCPGFATTDPFHYENLLSNPSRYFDHIWNKAKSTTTRLVDIWFRWYTVSYCHRCRRSKWYVRGVTLFPFSWNAFKIHLPSSFAFFSFSMFRCLCQSHGTIWIHWIKTYGYCDDWPPNSRRIESDWSSKSCCLVRLCLWIIVIVMDLGRWLLLNSFYLMKGALPQWNWTFIIPRFQFLSCRNSQSIVVVVVPLKLLLGLDGFLFYFKEPTPKFESWLFEGKWKKLF